MATIPASSGCRADFKVAPWWGFLFSGGGMTQLAVLAFAPGVVPYSSLGYLGSFFHGLAYGYHSLLATTFFIAAALHVLEGAYQWSLCRRHNFTAPITFLWVLQTTALGFPSLLTFRKIVKKKN